MEVLRQAVSAYEHVVVVQAAQVGYPYSPHPTPPPFLRVDCTPPPFRKAYGGVGVG
jgi:hypothetical protein